MPFLFIIFPFSLGVNWVDILLSSTPFSGLFLLFSPFSFVHPPPHPPHPLPPPPASSTLLLFLSFLFSVLRKNMTGRSSSFYCDVSDSFATNLLMTAFVKTKQQQKKEG